MKPANVTMGKLFDNRWGGLIFLLSLAVLTGTLFLVSILAHSEGGSSFTLYLPATGTSLGVFGVLLSHVAYGRVHNFKIFLLSHLTALFVTAFFLLDPSLDFGWKKSTSEWQNLLYILAFINGLIVTWAPSGLSYRWSKRWVYGWLLFQIGALYFLISYFQVPSFLKILEPSSKDSWRLSFGIFSLISVVASSLVFMQREFHAGGIVAGLALLMATAWLSPLLFFEANQVENAMIAATALFLVIGLFWNLFVCLSYRVAIDPLLQIYNRSYCERILSEQAKMNTAPPFSVAMVDIDHFKKVNDTHGHQAGDVVLYRVAQTVSSQAGKKGVVCRYGGEEIAVFFPKTSRKAAAALMEKVRTSVEKQKVDTGKKKIQVTVSSGVAERENGSQGIADIMQAADKALYRAKKGGRNQVCLGRASRK